VISLEVALVDTSAAVALVVADHEHHADTVSGVAGRRLGLAGHAWFETYSVLTRLPGPARRPPDVVSRVLNHSFPESRFLDAGAAGALCADLPSLGIAGGSVYDALVAAVSAGSGLPLITRDVRAIDTYRALGAAFELLPAARRAAG
jgi:hypothetical protein